MSGLGVFLGATIGTFVGVLLFPPAPGKLPVGAAVASGTGALIGFFL